jgi:hypothetical protein
MAEARATASQSAKADFVWLLQRIHSPVQAQGASKSWFGSKAGSARVVRLEGGVRGGSEFQHSVPLPRRG